ncbi:hypothetical protein V8F20_001381 [Naviculisporaceae sp. PSN 640]
MFALETTTVYCDGGNIATSPLLLRLRAEPTTATRRVESTLSLCRFRFCPGLVPVHYLLSTPEAAPQHSKPVRPQRHSVPGRRDSAPVHATDSFRSVLADGVSHRLREIGDDTNNASLCPMICQRIDPTGNYHHFQVLYGQEKRKHRIEGRGRATGVLGTHTGRTFDLTTGQAGLRCKALVTRAHTARVRFVRARARSRSVFERTRKTAEGDFDINILSLGGSGSSFYSPLALQHSSFRVDARLVIDKSAILQTLCCGVVSLVGRSILDHHRSALVAAVRHQNAPSGSVIPNSSFDPSSTETALVYTFTTPKLQPLVTNGRGTRACHDRGKGISESHRNVVVKKGPLRSTSGIGGYGERRVLICSSSSSSSSSIKINEEREAAIYKASSSSSREDGPMSESISPRHG